MAVPERLSRAEKREQTRSRLMDAAAEVIRRRGYGAASVEAIAAEAGYTRGAFYSNFESKEQLFVALLQDRVYRNYRRLLEELPESGGHTPLERLRWGAEQLAERQRNDEDRWLFELWLEVLAQSAREPELARLAAGFWTGTRATVTAMSEAAAAEVGRELPVPAKHLAIAQTALDIGLAVQHLVDPEEVPLDLYPELFELLFGPYAVPPGDG